MKKEKGFTLIELLAVIIILGILMIIAIPSVTSYISSARKSAYVDTARELISSTRNVVNEGRLGMYDTSATYYIPSSCIKVENSDEAESPYGKFTKAYVVVTYEGNKYNYYWKSVDESGQGIPNLTAYADLDTDLLVTDLKEEDIELDLVPGKTKVVEFNSDCTETITHSEEAANNYASTTDHITWKYRDLKMTVDIHLSQCNIEGDYRVCYNATVDVYNIGDDVTIKSFVATFDVPAGTQIVHSGYSPEMVKIELNGTKLKVIGNAGNNTWSYLTPNDNGDHMDSEFQIKFPKDEEFILQNGSIEYVELVSGVQEGNTQGTPDDFNQDLAKLNVRLVRKTYYNGASGFVEQYHVYVTNISNTDVTDWSFILDAPSEITNISSYSPLMYSKNGNVYTFTPFEWDNDARTLSPGETVYYDSKLVIETTDTNAIPVIR